MPKKLWDGRFTEMTDEAVEAFTSSINHDKRLSAYDIAGSIAHCRMLAKQSIISQEDASIIIEGLGRIGRDIERGDFRFDEALEDIHMNIESVLTNEIGEVAQKLHTGRSRNDQVVLDVRMYLRDELGHILNALTRLRGACVDLAEKHIGVMMPGYTHLRRAQPILFSHHIMAYYEMFSRDRERFKGVLERVNVLPLGSAALAGTTYPIDMQYTAELLNFQKVSTNSLDAVSSRDFILEFLSAASIFMVNISRLSEELILWSSSEFDFIDMPDAFTTGSSIMPQKKNPDVAELARGKSGRVFGSLMSVLTLMKGLVLSYNRDMQEDKEPLFDTVDTVKQCLAVYERLIPRLIVKKASIERWVNVGFLNATDVADFLVTKGMPFRQAHRCTGEVVRYAIEQGKEIHELSLEELKQFSRRFSEDLFPLLEPRQMIDRRVSPGGTATENVQGAIEAAKHVIAEEMGK